MSAENVWQRLKRLGEDFVDLRPGRKRPSHHGRLLYRELLELPGLRPEAILEFTGRPLLYLIDISAASAKPSVEEINALRHIIGQRGDPAYLVLLEEASVAIFPGQLLADRTVAPWAARLPDLTLLNIGTLALQGVSGLGQDPPAFGPRSKAPPTVDVVLYQLLAGLFARVRKTLPAAEPLLQIGFGLELVVATLLIRKSLDMLGRPDAVWKHGKTPLPLTIEGLRDRLRSICTELTMYPTSAAADFEAISDDTLAALLPALVHDDVPSKTLTLQSLDFRHISSLLIAGVLDRIVYAARKEITNQRPVSLYVPQEIAEYTLRYLGESLLEEGAILIPESGTGTFLVAVIRRRAALLTARGKTFDRSTLTQGLVVGDAWLTHMRLSEVVSRMALLELVPKDRATPALKFWSVQKFGYADPRFPLPLIADLTTAPVVVGRLASSARQGRKKVESEVDLIHRHCADGGRYVIAVPGEVLHSFDDDLKAARRRLLTETHVKAILDYTEVVAVPPFRESFAVLVGTRTPAPVEAQGGYQPSPYVHDERIVLGDDAVALPYSVSEIRDTSWMLRAMALAGGPEARVLDRLVADHPRLSADLKAHGGTIADMRLGPLAGLRPVGACLLINPDYRGKKTLRVSFDEAPGLFMGEIVVSSPATPWLRHVQRILESGLPWFWSCLMSERSRAHATDTVPAELASLPIAPLTDLDPDGATPDEYLRQVYKLHDEDLAVVRQARRRSNALDDDPSFAWFDLDSAYPSAYATALHRGLEPLFPAVNGRLAKYLGFRGPWLLFAINAGAPAEIPDIDEIAEAVSVNTHLSRQLLHYGGHGYILARLGRQASLRNVSAHDDITRYLSKLSESRHGR